MEIRASQALALPGAWEAPEEAAYLAAGPTAEQGGTLAAALALRALAAPDCPGALRAAAAARIAAPRVARPAPAVRAPPVGLFARKRSKRAPGPENKMGRSKVRRGERAGTPRPGAA